MFPNNPKPVLPMSASTTLPPSSPARSTYANVAGAGTTPTRTLSTTRNGTTYSVPTLSSNTVAPTTSALLAMYTSAHALVKEFDKVIQQFLHNVSSAYLNLRKADEAVKKLQKHQSANTLPKSLRLSVSFELPDHPDMAAILKQHSDLLRQAEKQQLMLLVQARQLIHTSLRDKFSVMKEEAIANYRTDITETFNQSSDIDNRKISHQEDHINILCQLLEKQMTEKYEEWKTVTTLRLRAEEKAAAEKAASRAAKQAAIDTAKQAITQDASPAVQELVDRAVDKRLPAKQVTDTLPSSSTNGHQPRDQQLKQRARSNKSTAPQAKGTVPARKSTVPYKPSTVPSSKSSPNSTQSTPSRKSQQGNQRGSSQDKGRERQTLSPPSRPPKPTTNSSTQRRPATPSPTRQHAARPATASPPARRHANGSRKAPAQRGRQPSGGSAARK